MTKNPARGPEGLNGLLDARHTGRWLESNVQPLLHFGRHIGPGRVTRSTEMLRSAGRRNDR